MFDKFKQLAQLKQMRDEAMRIQRELAGEMIEVSRNGVRVVVSGDQKIQTLESNGRSDEDIKEAVNEAVKKAQEVAAKKLAQMSGGISGLLGG